MRALRLLAIGLGLAELLAPRRVIDAATRLAYESPEEFAVKPWVVTAVRIEGLAFLGLAAWLTRRATGDE
ncbi:hypothetical protein [Halorussus amylolyticus]|uniref:hypothetical protein n=1 Tax=Halorussus amylolyticus TaxID=1126242 RepID=UPI00138F902A|nr:hypothetical protein [Halorussus amylolyticus]